MLPIFPETAPIQNPFIPPVILCQPPPSLPTCLHRDLKAVGSQGIMGKQLRMDFGSWMKELDNNCTSLSEGNTKKQDHNLPVLS